MLSITQKPASKSNYSLGRFGYQLNLIVIHTQDGFESGTDAWFANPSSHVSAHYNLALNGELHQSVQDQDTAWHAGNWSYNCRSLGVEFEDNRNPNGIQRTDVQYATGAQLIAAKCKQYSIPCDRVHIIGHHEVPGNDHPHCPGNEDIDRLIREANAILNVPVPITVVSAPPQSPHGTVKVTAIPWLNLRTEPTSLSPLATGYDAAGNPITHLPQGAEVSYVDAVQGQVVGSTGTWLKSIRGHWFWAGGTNYNKQGVLARVVGLFASKV